MSACTYIHTCTHTHIHTLTHSHTQMHTQSHTYMHTHTLTNTHTYTHMHTHSDTQLGARGQVPGLALPPSAEFMDRLRTGQGIAVAVIHLNTIIADTHGICGHDS